MKNKLYAVLKRLGHFQALLLLTLLFLLVVVPYGLLLKICGSKQLPAGRWSAIDNPTLTLFDLQRSF